MVLRLIRWSGLLVLFQETKGSACCARSCFLAWTSGACEMVEWIALAAAPITGDDVGTWPHSVGSWLSGLPSWPRCTGQRLGLILGSVVYLLLKCSFCASCGLVRCLSQKRPFSGIGGLDVQFQCRLFRLVQALIFGIRAGSQRRFFALCVLCLVGLASSSLLITAGSGILGGKSVDMVSRLGLGRLLGRIFSMGF